MCTPSPFLVTLPTTANSGGLAHDYVLIYPYIIIWTNRVDVWRFAAGSYDLAHVATLSENVDRPYLDRIPQSLIDQERGILVIPEWNHLPTLLPQLWVYNLADGGLLREVKLFGRFADTPIPYRNGHAMTVILEDFSSKLPPLGQTTMVLCDLTGDDGVVSRVNLPKDLAEREGPRGNVSHILEPIFLSMNGDVLATSTTPSLGKIDLLRWRGPQIADGQQPDARLQLLPVRQETQSMIMGCYTNISQAACLLCAQEEVELQCREFAYLTSVVVIDVETMSVQWSAEPLWGKATRVQHVPSLGLVLVTGTRELDSEDQTRMDFREVTFAAALDARTGARQMLDTIDPDIQGDDVVSIATSADPVQPSLVTIWYDGAVNITDLEQFSKSGFDRDGHHRLHTTATFPGRVTTADVAERSIVAVVDILTYRSESENGSFEAASTEEATVFMAGW
jgi:hypothetical protein